MDTVWSLSKFNGKMSNYFTGNPITHIPLRFRDCVLNPEQHQYVETSKWGTITKGSKAEGATPYFTCHGKDCKKQRMFYHPDDFDTTDMRFVSNEKARKKYGSYRKYYCKMTTNGENCDSMCITGKDQLCKYHYKLLEIKKINTKGYGELRMITEH